MRTLPVVLGLAAAAAAQSVTIPSIASTTRPTLIPYWTANVFYQGASRSQSIVDVNDVTVPATLWNSLAVRRPVSLGNANAAFTANATITLSVSPLAWTAVGPTFATNHGPNLTTVLNTQISLPAATNQPTWPAPWQTPFPFSVPFPFVKTMGQSLVIDILQTASTGTQPWYVEATPPDNGTRANNGNAQSSCRFSNGNYNNSLSYNGTIIPGANWFVNYGSILPNAIGVAAIGSQGVGGSWNGIPLPFDLTPLGAPGCAWHVSVLYMIGLAANASGGASWPQQTIPNDPSLAGAAFYDHAAFVDPLANAMGLVTTWSSKWSIGTQIGAPGTLVSAVGAAATNPSGQLTRALLPTLQLNP
jgi:hypothetical protein